MTSIPLPLLGLAAAWIAACLLAAGRLWLGRRGQPLTTGRGFALAGVGLLALAPCTLIAVRLLSGETRLFGALLQVALALLLFAAARQARRAGLDPEATGSLRSYREKSAWLVLLALALVFGNYFLGAWNAAPAQALSAFADAVVLLLVLMVAGHVVIALFHNPADDLDSPEDERDRAVNLKSMRNAYYVLAAGFWSVPVMLIVPLPLAVSLNIWLAVLVLAEIAYYGSVVAAYRRGVA